MQSMTPELDERFSDDNAVATSWDEVQDVLETAQLSWITTVRADGRPHVTPLVAVWLDDELHFCTGPAEQKGRNLESNPHVVVTTGCNMWDRGLDVMVEGDAVRVTDEARLQRLGHAWRAKWNGEWNYGVGDGGFTHDDDPSGGHDLVHVYAVRPAKVLAFGKGTFSHTRFRTA
jgi:nitroimidazol reductase NimA-like FMN-containing flavoprotein (pyridoxamine 5'-phosphate oxidase superfamily)